MIARRAVIAGLIGGLLCLVSPRASALEPDKDGWFHTGEGVRTKSIVFVTIKAYAIGHWVKVRPAQKSKRAVIELEADKRLVFRMLRDVPANKIKSMFRDSFALNGYGDKAKIEAFLAVYTAELKEGARTTISYEASKRATTITAQGGRTATIVGSDFMRATWSVWFGKSEQPELGDALISKL